jgi:hypothetical protein
MRAAATHPPTLGRSFRLTMRFTASSWWAHVCDVACHLAGPSGRALYSTLTKCAAVCDL